jgi:hypothetical protein
VSGKRSAVALVVSCMLALAVMPVATGCSRSQVDRASGPKASVSATPAVAVSGPYRRGQTAVAGSIRFVLESHRVCDPRWIRLSERWQTGPVAQSTPATAGHNYVDAAVRVRDLDATATTGMAISAGPRLGDPYILAGGNRYQRVDGAATGMASDEPTVTMVAEFELPIESTSAVLYWPTSEAATQVVSFTLW